MPKKIPAAILMTFIIMSLAACTDQPSPSTSTPEPLQSAAAKSNPLPWEVAPTAAPPPASASVGTPPRSTPNLSPEEIEQKAHEFGVQAGEAYLQALDKKFGPAK